LDMEELDALLKEHEVFRQNSLNLVASENVMSETARRFLSSDLVHRYIDEEFYGGTRYAEKIVEIAKNSLAKLFSCEYVFVDPLSGNMAHMAALMAFTRSGDKVAVIDFKYGGYPFRYNDFERHPIYIAFDEDEFNIDAEKTKEILLSEKPKLVFLGASIILFPQPVKEISEVAHDIGAVVAYDASHVLGLIAGKKFQDPLREGADLVVASTHKTFGGPQGGIVFTNDHDVARRIKYVLDRPPLLVDNPHVHRIGALAVTALEMLRYGKEYAEQIVRNSKELGAQLHKWEIEVRYGEKGYTETHQLYYPQQPEIGRKIRDKLEEAHIITDTIIRFGTQEVTRRGMKGPEMRKIAEAIYLALSNRIDEAKNIVRNLTSKFRKIHYSFDINKKHKYDT